MFSPDPDSNALNTDDLASVTLTVNDLGRSGDGGAQESEPISISLVVSAVNDRPLVDSPGTLSAKEDVPLVVSGLQVFDKDSDEPGGEEAELLKRD